MTQDRVAEIAKMEELAGLLERFPDAGTVVNRRLDEGAPFLQARVLRSGTSRTGRTVITGLELAKWLQKILLTLRTRHIETNEIQGRAGPW